MSPDTIDPRLPVHLADLFPQPGELRALATAAGVPSRLLTDENPAPAETLVKEAAQRGNLKTLLKAALVARPGDPLLKGMLKADPRFTGEGASAASVVNAAHELRQALAGWAPTHVVALSPEARPLAALLADGLDGAEPLEPWVDVGAAQAALRALPGPVRLVIVAVDADGEAAASALAEALHDLPHVALRLVTEGGAPRPTPG